MANKKKGTKNYRRFKQMTIVRLVGMNASSKLMHGLVFNKLEVIMSVRQVQFLILLAE